MTIKHMDSDDADKIRAGTGKTSIEAPDTISAGMKMTHPQVAAGQKLTLHEPVTPPTRILFQKHNVTVAAIDWSEGTFTVEGDYDAAAEQFVEALNELNVLPTND